MMESLPDHNAEIKGLMDTIEVFSDVIIKFNPVLSSLSDEYEQAVAITTNPDFIFDAELMKNIAKLEEKRNKVESLINLCHDTIEFINYINDTLDYTIEDIQQASANVVLLRDIHDEVYNLLFEFSGDDTLSCTVSILAGAGGTEAEDWAGMLFRMYLRWCMSKDYNVTITNTLPSIEAKDGLKKISFIVEGFNVYGFLKHENGVHRLIRKSPFDSSGKRHTSFASVKVTPIIDDTITINIDKNDVRVDTMRGSGAGGQHRNKTDSAVRLTHIPTGITAYCQSERSQTKNKEDAWKVLYSRLYELEKEKQDANKQKKGDNSIAFGSQIRTYWLHPTQHVKDHRSGHSIYNFDSVLDGKIDNFIYAMIEGDI